MKKHENNSEYYLLNEHISNDGKKLGLTQNIHSWKPYEINVGKNTIKISASTYNSDKGIIETKIVKTIKSADKCHVPMIHNQQDRIAIADNYSDNTQLFDLIKLKSLKNIPVTVDDSCYHRSSSFKFSPEQQVFANVTSITKNYATINMHTEQVTNAFSKNEQTITLWKCKTYTPHEIKIAIPSGEHVEAMAFSSYGHKFAAAINDKIKISHDTLKDSEKSDYWDVESGKMIHATNLMFSPDGMRLFAQDPMEVKILSADNAGVIGTIKLSNYGPIKFAFGHFAQGPKFAIIQDVVDNSGWKPLGSLKLYDDQLPEVDQSLEVIGNFQISGDLLIYQQYGGMIVYDEIPMIGDMGNIPESS